MVRERFTHVQDSVMVVGYAVYRGDQVFESLAKRIEEPNLKVQFFLNIARPDGDMTKSEILVAKCKERFKSSHWPAGYRLPEVYGPSGIIVGRGLVHHSKRRSQF